LFSSIIIVPSFPTKISERGVKLTLWFGKIKGKTCYTANFLSAASGFDITIINI